MARNSHLIPPILSILFFLSIAPCEAATRRAVSLNALAPALKAGDSAQARNLCGITKVTGYLTDPSAKDVIVVGEVDPSLPALHADDLAVALRNAWLFYAKIQGRVRYYSAPGCSIDPDPAVLRELQGVMNRVPDSEDPDAAKASFEEWESIGRRPQRVRVMGVPFDSRFARVMVDADYYMKRLVNGSVNLGIDGFESLSDMNIRSMKQALAEGKWDSVPKNTLSRFWFSPGEATYSEDDGVVLLESCSVKLLTEEEFLTEHGQVAGMGRPNPMAAVFAKSFTTRYSGIAAARPIYKELEGLFRLVGLARLMKDAGARCKGLDYLLKSHPVAVVPVSRAVNGLTNVREIRETRDTPDGTAVSRMWLTSCGGVSMDVRPKRVKPAARTATSAPAARKPVSASGSPPRTARVTASRAPSLKKTILSARKSPGALSWDF